MTKTTMRVEVECALDDEDALYQVYSWFERWKPEISTFERRRSEWNERIDIVASRSALKELPDDIVRVVHE